MDRSQQKDQLILTKPQYTLVELLKAYWQSPYRRMAYFVFCVIILMSIFMVGLDVVFNIWYRFFYNALQAYDAHQTIRLLIIFCIIAFVNIIVAVYRYYISQVFGLKWRRWLTDQFISRWLMKRGYYYLENFDEKTDNPDQRIQEDIGALVLNTLALAVGIVTSITSFFAFMYILWVLSGTISLSIWPFGTFQLHGYLVWVTLIYSVIGTYLTFKIGRPLIDLNFEQQHREATFRYAAIDLRSHAEDVALYRGENHQKNILDRLFSRVLENWYFIILRQKLLLWFTSGFNQIAVFLPLVVALPNYFGKVFLLGGLIQTLQAFRNVQDSLSYLVNSYTQIAEWRAIGKRLTTFVNHLNEVETRAATADKLIVEPNPEAKIVTQNMEITTPQNKTLLKNVNEEFIHGKHYLIKGRSGIGKSTFIRSLAGIWPYASGNVKLPQQRLMFVPQETYMPIGTLAEAILFPNKNQGEDRSEDLKNVLKLCNLAHFIPRLNEVTHWSEQLSPGEQQRIAFARVLLQQPDWAFLDESTSMLDMENEKNLYELVRTKLPHCSIISIGHRPSLIELHDYVIDLSRYSPG